MAEVAGAWASTAVVVTGARGFIGRHVCAALERRGATVHAAGAAAIRALAPDYIIHLAGAAVVPAGAPVSAAYAANALATVDLLEAAAGVGSIRGIVVASSASVYGPGELSAPAPAESQALVPVGPYATSKACADIIARSYHRSAGLPVVTARLVNVYGPGDTQPTRLVPSTMEALRERRDPVLASDGRDVRDYLFVTDAVAALLALAQAAAAPAHAGQAFNAGTGTGTSSLDLVRTAIAVTGQAARRPIVGPAVRPPIQYTVDISRIAAATGWSAAVSLEQGLRLTWESRTAVATA